jgi:predicted deacylase
MFESRAPQGALLFQDERAGMIRSRFSESVVVEPQQAWIWQRAGGAGASNDLDAWRRELAACAQDGGWQLQELGPVLGQSLPLLRTGQARAGAPPLLIASGFHGEEPAGPWGVIEFMRTLPEALAGQVDLSLLPLVNATGFAAGTRFNSQGENPNRGYGIHANGDLPSIEGHRLIANVERLLPLAADGLLACHEDVGLCHAYAYTYERRPDPGDFSRMLVATAATHFDLHPDGVVDECPVSEGLVFNRFDGSFECWFSEQGVPLAACIETPGQHDFTRRVLAQAALMRAFVEHAVTLAVGR